MEIIKKKSYYNTIAIFIVSGIVFVWLFLQGNYGIAGDSDSYLTFSIAREPIYPLFLLVFRKLFGEGEAIYIPLAVVQNAIAAISCAMTALYLGKTILKSEIGKWICLAGLVLPHLMTPLFAKSGLVMTNKIMTEGITISIYYIFMIYIVKMIVEKKQFYKHIVISSLFVLCLVLIKGQMMVLIVGLGIIVAVKFCLKKHYIGIFASVLGVGLLFFLTATIASTFHYINSGIYTNTVSSAPMIVANVLYVSEREDGAGIEDEKLQTLFYMIYDTLEENQMLAKNSPSGILNRAFHHEKMHDAINFDVFVPAKNNVYEEIENEDYGQYLLLEDQVAKELTKELLKVNWKRYLQNYVSVCTLGFVRSISIDRSIFISLTWILYGIAILLALFTIRKRGWNKEVQFFLSVFMLMIGFVMGTSLILQCITRYVIYNMPFFYIAILGMIKCNWDYRGRKKGN